MNPFKVGLLVVLAPLAALIGWQLVLYITQHPLALLVLLLILAARRR